VFHNISWRIYKLYITILKYSRKTVEIRQSKFNDRIYYNIYVSNYPYPIKSDHTPYVCLWSSDE
jgi:hypothetical protein